MLCESFKYSNHENPQYTRDEKNKGDYRYPLFHPDMVLRTVMSTSKNTLYFRNRTLHRPVQIHLIAEESVYLKSVKFRRLSGDAINSWSGLAEQVSNYPQNLADYFNY